MSQAQNEEKSPAENEAPLADELDTVSGGTETTTTTTFGGGGGFGGGGASRTW